MYYTVTVNNSQLEEQFDTYTDAKNYILQNFSKPIKANIYGEDENHYEEYNITVDNDGKINIAFEQDNFDYDLDDYDLDDDY